MLYGLSLTFSMSSWSPTILGFVYKLLTVRFSLTAQSSCQKCPAGSECPNRGTPAQCSAGYYSVEGSGICDSCPPGFYSSAAGKSVRDLFIIFIDFMDSLDTAYLLIYLLIINFYE